MGRGEGISAAGAQERDMADRNAQQVYRGQMGQEAQAGRKDQTRVGYRGQDASVGIANLNADVQAQTANMQGSLEAQRANQDSGDRRALASQEAGLQAQLANQGVDLRLGLADKQKGQVDANNLLLSRLQGGSGRRPGQMTGRNTYQGITPGNMFG